MEDTILKVAAERHDELGAKVTSIIVSTPSLVDAYARYYSNCFTYILEKNNEEDDDNLEDLGYAEEETVESEYIVKPGYLQVIRGIFGDGSDDDVGDHDAETVRHPDEQSEEIPPDQQPSTRKRRKGK
ncbi:hypothetical protein JTB14_016667 [Gonioctena quinquepunctata]|nr:hypothetical protein JTB14_016667 [Gonioctena quinquepunctata]